MPPSQSSVAVVIPTYNEAAAIGGVVAALPRDVVDRIIVADGGSSDRTADLARRAGAEVIDVGNGYGRACLAGAEAADDADIVVFMDGDGADDPVFIEEMVGAIRSGNYDFVIGSRARGEREVGSMGSHQILLGLLAGALIRFFYGVRYTDMCAYRAIRRDTLLALGMRERTYGWNLGNADACGARPPARPRIAGRLSPPCRRRIQGCRQSARIDQSRFAHHRHVCARGDGITATKLGAVRS